MAKNFIAVNDLKTTDTVIDAFAIPATEVAALRVTDLGKYARVEVSAGRGMDGYQAWALVAHADVAGIEHAVERHNHAVQHAHYVPYTEDGMARKIWIGAGTQLVPALGRNGYHAVVIRNGNTVDLIQDLTIAEYSAIVNTHKFVCGE